MKRSWRKKGFPVGTDWQRGLRLSTFCPVLRSSSELQGQVVSGDGETNAGGGAWNGKKNSKNYIVFFSF